MTTPDNRAVPTWPALLMSMIFGEIEEGSFTGLVRVTDPGPDTTVRVFKRFGEYRVETPDGELITIRKHCETYEFVPGLGAPSWASDDEGRTYDEYAHVIERRPLHDWKGDDFTHPTGPARPVAFLGRPCWEVELAPPDHKPSPLVLTIDAATGMQLKAESRTYGVLEEWLELDFGVELDDDLFGWDGDTVTPHELWCSANPDWVIRERRAKKHRAKERKWLKSSGLGDLRLRYEAKFDVEDVDMETGTFAAGVTAHQWFTLGRRRPSKKKWPTTDDFSHEVLWTEGDWQWRLRSDERIRKRTLKHLKKQIRAL